MAHDFERRVLKLEKEKIEKRYCWHKRVFCQKEKKKPTKITFFFFFFRLENHSAGTAENSVNESRNSF